VEFRFFSFLVFLLLLLFYVASKGFGIRLLEHLSKGAIFFLWLRQSGQKPEMEA